VLRSLIRAERERRARVLRFDWRGLGCPHRGEHGPGGHLPGLCHHARPSQILPPGDWRLWLLKAGRGFGKTRVGAESVREWSEAFPRIGLIAPTKDDAREIMVEGESGVLSVFPPDRPARYIANRRRIEFPSGSIGTIYTADEPERLRGPQHHKLWMDEIASWRYLDDAFDMAMLGLRLGNSPQAVLTSTPKNRSLIRNLRDRSRLAPGTDPLGTVLMTEGSTYDNRENLADSFVNELVRKYEGTRLGRQELLAEVLEEVEGALWAAGMIEPYRVAEVPDSRLRTVVAVDPATTSGPDSDETGIAVGVLDTLQHVYVPVSEGHRVSPSTWATRVLALYDQWEADCIVAETNQGGQMVTETIRNVCMAEGRSMPRVKTVHAKKGKATRAEPVVALYEQGRVHHVGSHDLLEDQQTSFVPPGGSEDGDDRLDALVYAVTELAVQQKRIEAY
jgi:phage terminase large subunit-like protein